MRRGVREEEDGEGGMGVSRGARVERTERIKVIRREDTEGH